MPDTSPRVKLATPIPCSKRKYRQIDAELALARTQHRIATGQQQGKSPTRTYHCPACGAWHLTSQASREAREA